MWMVLCYTASVSTLLQGDISKSHHVVALYPSIFVLWLAHANTWILSASSHRMHPCLKVCRLGQQQSATTLQKEGHGRQTPSPTPASQAQALNQIGLMTAHYAGMRALSRLPRIQVTCSHSPSTCTCCVAASLLLIALLCAWNTCS